MAKITGRTLALSLPRRWIADLMYLSKGVPIASIEKEFDLGELAEARWESVRPPTWTSLFLKSYAQVAAEMAPLRRCYMSFPWPHLYEVDVNIATVAVTREFEREAAVFFAPLASPEHESLARLTQRLHHAKTAPIPELPAFRRLIRITRYPFWIRRFIWWIGYHVSGKLRAKHFGTFGVSVLGGSGVTLLDLIFPVTTTLTVGPVSEEGRAQVRLYFDHRVLDGATAAQALHRCEEVLRTQLLQELTPLRCADKSAQ